MTVVSERAFIAILIFVVMFIFILILTFMVMLILASEWVHAPNLEDHSGIRCSKNGRAKTKTKKSS